MEIFNRSESFLILKSATVRAAGLSLTVVSLPIMTFVVFSVYTATGGVLTPKKVFTVLSLIINLKLHGVHAVVYTAVAISEGLVAISRISVRCNNYIPLLRCCYVVATQNIYHSALVQSYCTAVSPPGLASAYCVLIFEFYPCHACQESLHAK